MAGPELSSARDAVPPYTTLDGSTIRELVHPSVHGNRAQSLAEATIAANGRTHLHRHRQSEEIYHVTAGRGWVWLAGRWIAVKAGDSLCIAPGTAHCAQAGPGAALVILCCCSPAYAHEDTELLPGDVPSPPLE
jgi:quercetin dioxygenase-like cupin family protein